GHHQASVMQRLGVTKANAKVIARFTDRGNFWQQMQAHRWVWLYDAKGRPIAPEALPKRIADLGDDPYRSLASYAEDAGYIKRTDIYFMEFQWARYFGERMHWQPVDRLSLLPALQQAERLACDPAAHDLPGYAGPCEMRK
ncbi:chromosome partitioning protein ParB, partial [Oxalobacteraceae bacterium OM1]